MPNGERVIPFTTIEDDREQQFKQVWVEQLDDVFSDVARYYERANYEIMLCSDWSYPPSGIFLI